MRFTTISGNQPALTKNLCTADLQCPLYVKYNILFINKSQSGTGAGVWVNSLQKNYPTEWASSWMPSTDIVVSIWYRRTASNWGTL